MVCCCHETGQKPVLFLLIFDLYFTNFYNWRRVRRTPQEWSEPFQHYRRQWSEFCSFLKWALFNLTAGKEVSLPFSRFIELIESGDQLHYLTTQGYQLLLAFNMTIVWLFVNVVLGISCSLLQARNRTLKFVSLTGLVTLIRQSSWDCYAI